MSLLSENVTRLVLLLPPSLLVEKTASQAVRGDVQALGCH